MKSEPASTASLPMSLRSNPLLSRWLRFDPTGEVWVQPGKVELGQGIATALAQLAAEELEVDITRVHIMPATTVLSPNEGYTAGSRSIEESGAAVRSVCAEVKALFLEAASLMLEVPLQGLSVVDGEFQFQGESLSNYWELAATVSLEVEASGAVVPSPLSVGRFLGRPQARIDSIVKVTGAADYIQNLVLPEMLHGRVVRPPSIYSRLVSLDSEVAGRADVITDGSFVGILASREEDAIRVAREVGSRAVWSSDQLLPVQSGLEAFLRSARSELEVSADFDFGYEPTGSLHRASYSRGFVAHGSIGPSCALAVWHDGALKVWSSTQSVYHLRHELARAFGIGDTDVTVQFVEGSGCYGHNGVEDAAFEAALMARAAPGRPVRLQWSREDELGWAPYGPAAVLDLQAELADDGLVSSWGYEVWSNGTGGRPGNATSGVAFVSASLLADPMEREAAQMGGVTRNSEPGYAFPQVRIASHRVMEVPIRTSSLRSLGAHVNVFATESFMDELAVVAGVDPIEYRLRQLSDRRGRAVIERVAVDSGWGKDLDPDHGLGIGYARYKGTSGYCAVAAEVEAGSVLRVVNLTIAVDVGFAINPEGVANQVIGGAVQSVSWTTLEEVRFSPERVESVTWETYPILRFSDVPIVRLSILGAEENPPLGAGEISQGPTAGAIGNALYNAIGLRVRDLPLTAQRIRTTAGL